MRCDCVCFCLACTHEMPSSKHDRCEEAKAELLALHAQDVLYSIRDSSAPGALQDAASAALRDLGMLDYLPKAR